MLDPNRIHSLEFGAKMIKKYLFHLRSFSDPRSFMFDSLNRKIVSFLIHDAMIIFGIFVSLNAPFNFGLLSHVCYFLLFNITNFQYQDEVAVPSSIKKSTTLNFSRSSCLDRFRDFNVI